ncbi:hypothetical protein WMF11_23125 [Sorangium sp. So ce295]|uniref:hypothetical protein n=1 Tax=Sorangium sp. So ce295 TaxID=3133295 RepID=UPI003F63F679
MQVKVRLELKGGDEIRLSISGRPNWANQISKHIVPPEGQSRGHVIEWSTMVRALVARVASSKARLKEILHTQANDESGLTSALVEHLKRLYNNPDNIVLNYTGKDNDAGGKANSLAQDIDRLGEGPTRTLKLKELFSLSFNPGIGGAGLRRLPEYLTTFSIAWSIPEKTAAEWAKEAGWGALGSTSELKLEEELIVEKGFGKTITIDEAFQETDPEWLEGAFEEFQDSPTKLEELAFMILGSYDDAKHLQPLYKMYLKQILVIIQRAWGAEDEAYQELARRVRERI